MQKTRGVILIPFDESMCSVLGYDGTQTIDSAFGLMAAPINVGDSPVGKAVQTFKKFTAVQTANQDWDRFHIEETSNSIIHFYTTVLDFGSLNLKTEFTPTSLSLLMLSPKSCSWLAVDEVVTADKPERLVDVERVYELRHLQGIISMARQAAQENWG